MFRKVQKLCLSCLLDPVLYCFISFLARLQLWSKKIQADTEEEDRSAKWQIQTKAWDQAYEDVKRAFSKN
jgi:hypothetical protein